MAIIVGNLAGKNKTKDYQLNAMVSSVISSGVISGLSLTGNELAAGVGVIELTRTGLNEPFKIPVFITENVNLTLGNNKFIYITIPQNNIDDGDTYNVETDGTNIAIVEVGNAWPTKNYLKIASTNSTGVVSDERESVIGILSGKANIEGGNIFNGPQRINNGVLNLDSTFQTVMQIREAGVLRWAIGKSNGNEDLEIYYYNDTGAYQGAALSILRDTGNTRFFRDLECSQNAKYLAATDMGNTDLDFAHKKYVDDNTGKFASQILTAPNISGVNSITYTHTLGKIPNKIEFEGYEPPYKSSGVYIHSDGSNRSVSEGYNNSLVLRNDKCVRYTFDNSSSADMEGEVTAVTATTFTIEWNLGTTSGHTPMTILAKLT